MEATTHQGFTNYATFGVAVTLETDAQHHARVMAYIGGIQRYKAADPNVADGIWTVEETERFRTEEAIRDYVETMVDDVDPPMAAGLVQAGLAEVDWADIARHFLIVFEENNAPALTTEEEGR